MPHLAEILKVTRTPPISSTGGEMKTQAKIAVVIVVVVASFTVLLGMGVFYTPPTMDHKETTTTYMPLENVVIQASTFNGDINVESTQDTTIVVTYSLTAPQGCLDEIKITNNETKTQNVTSLLTSAQNLGNFDSPDYSAILTLKLPVSFSYNLTLITSNGDIIKPDLNGAKVAVSTMNGDITISDGDDCRSIDATCMNGNLKIRLVQGTQFSVVASIGNGEINYQGIPLDTSTQSATRLKGSTTGGEGNLTVSLMTGNGNIKLQYYNP